MTRYIVRGLVEGVDGPMIPTDREKLAACQAASEQQARTIEIMRRRALRFERMYRDWKGKAERTNQAIADAIDEIADLRERLAYMEAAE